MDILTLTESPFATDDDVRTLLTAFHETLLPRSAWNHRAHMSVALSFGRALPADQALNAMRVGILKFNESVGIVSTPDVGYHETITSFYIDVITLRVVANPAPHSLAHDANSLMDVWGRPDLPLDFWSRELLFSRDARARWVAPDRHALPDAP